MNGDTFILYTEEEGGIFKPIRGTEEQFNRAVEKGFLVIPREDRGEGHYDAIRPAYLALLRVESNHDFVLGSPREQVAAA